MGASPTPERCGLGVMKLFSCFLVVFRGSSMLHFSFAPTPCDLCLDKVSSKG